MRCKGLLGMLWLMWATLPCLAIEPASVAILYNSADAESKELAEFYAKARSIPAANLVGLEMPKQQEIDRQQYEEVIAKPLRKVFEERDWWQLRKDPKGVMGPMRNKIRVLVTMRGVPLKIRQSPRADGQAHPDRKKSPFTGHDEASVDSELATLGIIPFPTEGAQRSGYFRSEKPIEQAGFPGIMLTARIDAPNAATCRRMIEDAIEVEESGLWGFHVVDIANKFPQGDDWLKGIAEENLKRGLPTLVDRFNPTLPSHFPLRDVACYYGWYDWNLSGPMLDPAFRFRKGAVAIHIHSFSAQQLRDPKKNWSGGLLEAGAAVTVGNVYEPYLGLTHHLDVLHERLLEGHTWVEACWMSLPSLSWQAVCLGDPLYRPFAHLEGSGKVLDADREYRALRAAMLEWGDKPGERATKLKEAATRMKSGIFLEALAFEAMAAEDFELAGSFFTQARALYPQEADQLRQDLLRILALRQDGKNELALLRLKALGDSYPELPQAKAIQVWIDQLDPPAQP